MIMTDDTFFRIECYKLAVQAEAADPVVAAQAYYDEALPFIFPPADVDGETPEP